MERTDFSFVFDKLAENDGGDNSTEHWSIVSDVTTEELDEIDELRRLSSELQPPEMVCFTTT